MSVRPPKSPPSPSSSPPAKKTTIARLAELRASGTPITVLTAYDFPTARACSAHPVDITLVGDSLAQVCLGYTSTTRLTLDEMLHHCRAVARGSTSPHFLVADMPDTVLAAVRMIQEGRVEAVKLEGGEEITQMGIPVMAHIGLLPQRHTSLSGYRVQGRTAESAGSLVRAALALQDAGAFSIVLEAMPSQLGAYITEQIKIPTIGIGAGPRTSGQVLVWDDMVGTWSGHKAKFVRYFGDVRKEVASGVAAYVDAVRDGSFPHPEREGYTMDHDEWEKFLLAEGKSGWTWSSKENPTTITGAAQKAMTREGQEPMTGENHSASHPGESQRVPRSYA
ncbi:ketopantoate hydroxymethyltransferase [Melanogaster broomeanus]|nr:ketopantoate hydroxymethyltransferase [Melanogaster broomeanus]